MGLITSTLDEVELLLQQCKEKALNIIKDSVKENSVITVIGDNPRMFTMNIKDLSLRSWSPRYYDYGWQFDNLIKVLENKNLSAFRTTIKNLLDTGKLGDDLYHPDVLAILKEVL